MSVEFQTLYTPMTHAQAKAFLYQTLDDLGMPTTSWKAGAVVRTIIALVAWVVVAISTLVTEVTKGGFRTKATGSALKLLARENFNVDALEAQFASGFIRLTNSGGGVYNINPGELIVQNPSTKATYYNVDSIVLGAGDTLDDVPILASVAGSDSTSPPGTITAFVTSLLDVTVVNPESVIGRDEETDEELRRRMTSKLDSLSPNGPLGAYDYFARTTTRPDGSLVDVNRVRTPPSSTVGYVSVVLASATGGVSTDDVTAVGIKIQESCVPIGITAAVQTAGTQTLNVTYECWVLTSAGMTSDDVKDAILEALTEYVATAPIGGFIIPPATSGFIYAELLGAIVSSAIPGNALFKLSVSVPAAPFSLLNTEVAVLGTVSGTVHLVSS